MRRLLRTHACIACFALTCCTSSASTAATRAHAAAVKAWRFPAPEGGGIVIVTYPFDLDLAPAAEGANGGPCAAALSCLWNDGPPERESFTFSLHDEPVSFM